MLPKDPPAASENVLDENTIISHDGREINLLRYIYNHPALNELRGSPTRILRAMDEFAAQETFLINIGPDKSGKIHALIQHENPSIFVELGAYVGYSAISFADAMRRTRGDTNLKHDLRLWSLEADPLMASITMNLVELAGLSDIVKVVVGPAVDSIKRLHAESKLVAIDFLFLDHVEDLYVADLELCLSLSLLNPGSVVVADNILVPGAPDYLAYIHRHIGMKSHTVKGLIIPGDYEVGVSQGTLIWNPFGSNSKRRMKLRSAKYSRPSQVGYWLGFTLPSLVNNPPC